METHKFKKGDIIALEGSIGVCAYLIESGKVEIASNVNGKRVVHSLLGENQVFNEIQLIVDEPVPQTATAIEDTELKIISREAFSVFFLKGDYTILSVLSALLERLRTANKKLLIIKDTHEELSDDAYKGHPAYKQEDISTDALAVLVNDMDDISPDEDDISADVSADDINNLLKEIPMTEDAPMGEKIVDKRYLILSGLNEISKDALKWKEVEIRKFPFKVGRVGKERFGDEVKSKIKIQDFELSENDLRMYEDGPHYYISINHFQIDKTGGVFTITDRGSRLGVIVNDMTVKGTCMLRQENMIIIGSPYSPYLFRLDIKGDIVVEEETEKAKKVKGSEKSKRFETINEDSGFDITGIK